VFRYSVYGLDLASDTALPELDCFAAASAAAAHPIKVHLGVATRRDLGTAHWLLRSALPGGDDLALCGKVEGGYLLRYVGAADFMVDRAGRELRCTRIEPGTSLQTLRHLLLDQVLPLVLNLLGCDVLHATAVETPAGVCAFIGPAGAGKSTLAASFAAAGYSTFCDDCLVVRRNGGILCTPGYPGVRLRNDSLAALGNLPLKAGAIADSISKHRLVIDAGNFPSSPRRLIAIYRIGRQADGEPGLSTARIEPLRGREAFMEAVSSAYVLDVTEPTTLLRHFRFIEQLVAQVPIARLLLADDFTLLRSARHAILSELGDA
jgi:hypothetical protein